MNGIKLPQIKFIYNRYGYASNSRDHVIELRIAADGRQKFMSTGIRVFKNQWSRGLVVNHKDAIILNKTLDKLMNDVRKIIYDMLEEGRVDIFAIPARLQAQRTPEMNWVNYCEERATVRKYGKAADTQERYDRFMRFLKAYGKINTFSDITEKKIMDMDAYLTSKNNMKAKSRWHNYHRFMKTFIQDAQKEGLIRLNPYDRVKIDQGDDEDSLFRFFTIEELQHLRQAQMPTPKMEEIRDVFVFQCYTCMAIHDLKKFNTKNLRDIGGEKVYMGYRGKTKKEYQIPMLKPALDILEKYHGKLPVRSNEYYNRRLKEVVAAAGIKKEESVTTHWARHTGATILLNAGVPIEIVAKVCGHANTRITEKIYAKMLPNRVLEAVGEVKHKII